MIAPYQLTKCCFATNSVHIVSRILNLKIPLKTFAFNLCINLNEVDANAYVQYIQRQNLRYVRKIDSYTKRNSTKTICKIIVTAEKSYSNEFPYLCSWLYAPFSMISMLYILVEWKISALNLKPQNFKIYWYTLHSRTERFHYDVSSDLLNWKDASRQQWINTRWFNGFVQYSHNTKYQPWNVAHTTVNSNSVATIQHHHTFGLSIFNKTKLKF